MKLKEMIESKKSLEQTVTELKKSYESVNSIVKEKGFDADIEEIKKATESKKEYESKAIELKNLSEDIEKAKAYQEQLVNESRENSSKKQFNGDKRNMLKNKEYLGSMEAMKDFNNIAGKAFSEGKDVVKSYTDFVKEKGLVDNFNGTGLTLPDSLLPTNIAQSFSSALSSTSTLTTKLFENAVLNGILKIFITKPGDVRGHNYGDTKDDGDVQIVSRTLDGQYIYTKTTNPNTPANRMNYDYLIKIVLAEQMKSFAIGFERAVTIGDGRQLNDKYKIKETSVLPIVKDFTDEVKGSGNTEGHFKMVTDIVKDGDIKDNDTAMMKLRKLIGAVDNVSNTSDLEVVISKKFYFELIGAVDNNNNPLLKTSNLPVEFGVANVVYRDYMDNDANYDAVVLDTSAYSTILTTMTPESFSFFDLTKNNTDYMSEVGASGALSRPLGAAFLRNVNSTGDEGK